MGAERIGEAGTDRILKDGNGPDWIGREGIGWTGLERNGEEGNGGERNRWNGTEESGEEGRGWTGEDRNGEDGSGGERLEAIMELEAQKSPGEGL